MKELQYYTVQMINDELFIQLPKWLIYDEKYAKLSNDAKILYCLLRDRHKLSLQNGWFDENNHVYIKCKRETMEALLKRSDKTVKKYVDELIKVNLITEISPKNNKANIIYLLCPTAKTYEEYKAEEDNYIDLDQNKATRKNSESGIGKIPSPDKEKVRSNKNNKNNNNLSNKESKNQTSNEIDFNEIERELRSSFKKLYQPIEGVFVNDKQLKEINELVVMVGTGELKATKDSLCKYIKQLYKNDFKDFKNKPIKNLKSYVAMNFKLQTKQNENEMEEIRKLAEGGDPFAQKILRHQTPDYELR